MNSTTYAAFGHGLVAAVNPCGFALLPAYVSYFLGAGGSDDPSPSTRTAALVRSLPVATAVSLGFVAVFGSFGLLAGATQSAIQEYLPYATIVIGCVLVGLGVATVAGFSWTARLPKLGVGGRTRGLVSMFLYGVSYAVASLSCAFPLFLTVMTIAFNRQGVLSGTGVLLAYAGGMALVLSAVTIATALARQSFVALLRSSMRYVERASAAIMLVMGTYVVWYGIYELRIRENPRAEGGPVDLVSSWNAAINRFVQERGAGTIGLILLLAVASAFAVAVAVGRNRRLRAASR